VIYLGEDIAMDFKKVLNLLIKDFDGANINYALIGGFAMGILGVVRATMDLDFIIDRNDLPKTDEILRKYNYNCVYKSENVSQYVSDIKAFGEIDILHAFREISVSMLKRTQEKDIFDGSLKIRVLLPEDIIGLKLQALVNNPKRENQEYADMQSIVSSYQGNLNWDLIKEYFDLFGKKEEYAKLKGEK
jgi:hypothetical protein